jgi:hypothetical protein
LGRASLDAEGDPIDQSSAISRVFAAVEIGHGRMATPCTRLHEMRAKENAELILKPMTSKELLVKTVCVAALALPLVSGCGGGSPEPESPGTVQTPQGEVPAPPPGGETEIETEGPDGSETKTEIETEKDD